jgi:hypothetical protein
MVIKKYIMTMPKNITNANQYDMGAAYQTNSSAIAGNVNNRGELIRPITKTRRTKINNDGAKVGL